MERGWPAAEPVASQNQNSHILSLGARVAFRRGACHPNIHQLRTVGATKISFSAVKGERHGKLTEFYIRPGRPIGRPAVLRRSPAHPGVKPAAAPAEPSVDLRLPKSLRRQSPCLEVEIVDGDTTSKSHACGA